MNHNEDHLRFIAVLETGILRFAQPAGWVPEVMPVAQNSHAIPVIGEIAWWSGRVPGLANSVHVQVTASPSVRLEFPPRGARPAAEAVDDALPAPAGGVNVVINGKPAAIYFVKPSEIHLSGPAEVVTGLVQVTIQNCAEAPPANDVPAVRSLRPGFFLLKRRPDRFGGRIELLGAGFSADREERVIDAPRSLPVRGPRSAAAAA